jgi:hypothetical protein
MSRCCVSHFLSYGVFLSVIILNVIMLRVAVSKGEGVFELAIFKIVEIILQKVRTLYLASIKNILKLNLNEKLFFAFLQWFSLYSIFYWTYTDTHTHTHAHAHAHIRTHTQSLSLTLSLSQTHTYTHTHTHLQ